jgi:hypothetical protein
MKKKTQLSLTINTFILLAVMMALKVSFNIPEYVAYSMYAILALPLAFNFTNNLKGWLKNKQDRQKSAIPVFVYAILICIFITIAVSDIVGEKLISAAYRIIPQRYYKGNINIKPLPNKQHFLKVRKRMMEVVDLIENRKLKPEKRDPGDPNSPRIKLPLKYVDLSVYGSVIYQETYLEGEKVVTIMFVTGTDLLDDDSYGYIYRSNDKPLSQKEHNYFSESTGGYITRFDNKWFAKSMTPREDND